MFLVDSDQILFVAPLWWDIWNSFKLMENNMWFGKKQPQSLKQSFALFFFFWNKKKPLLWFCRPYQAIQNDVQYLSIMYEQGLMLKGGRSVLPRGLPLKGLNYSWRKQQRLSIYFLPSLFRQLKWSKVASVWRIKWCVLHLISKKRSSHYYFWTSISTGGYSSDGRVTCN